MQTLLDMFKEESVVDTNVKNLHKLQEIYKSREGEVNYNTLKFQIETLFHLFKTLDAKNIKIRMGRESQKLDKLEFNPTISEPNITFTDKDKNAYSVWYKPVVYVPSKNSAKKISPDFIFLKGEHSSMYEIDKGLKKSLYAYEFLSDSVLKEISGKLLEKLKEVQLVLHSSEEYKYRDLSHIVDSKHYLDPNRVFLVSEKHLPNTVKMDMPLGVKYEENVGMNKRKLRKSIKKAFSF